MILKNTPKGIGGHMGKYHKDLVIRKPSVIFTIKCLVCNKLVANSNNVLGRHVKKEHSLEYSEYLVKYTYNGIWPTCECGCKKKVKWHFGGFSRFASKSCASKGKNNGMFGLKGGKSPNTGKIRTKEHREHYKLGARKRWDEYGDMLREMMKSDEYRETQRLAQIEGNIANPERNEKRAISSIKTWRSPEMAGKRKEAAERAIRLLEEGKIGPQAPFKTCWMDNPFTGKAEWMQCGWEVTFLEVCIEEQFPVTKVHGIRIPYVRIDGTEHLYLPDFIGIENKIMFEIKGRRDEDTDRKDTAAREWCQTNGYEFRVIGNTSS